MTEEQRQRLSSDPPEAVDPETELKRRMNLIRQAQAGSSRPMAEGIAAPETAHVQVDLDATGTHGTVVIDGTDLSRRIKAVHMSVTAGVPAGIVLEATAAGFSYEGPGVVKLVEEVSTPWVPQALAWLDGVDWQGVQRAVAEGSMGASIGAAVRDVLLSELRRFAADTSGQAPS